MKLQELLRVMNPNDQVVIRVSGERRIAFPRLWLHTNDGICGLEVHDVRCADGMVMVSVGENWR